MKVETFHNRIERREFTFTTADVEKVLKAAIMATPFGHHTPAGAVAERWTLDWDTDGDTGHLSAVTITQTFEYLRERTDSPASVGAVDPSAADPGTPTPRDKSSSSSSLEISDVERTIEETERRR